MIREIVATDEQRYRRLSLFFTDVIFGQKYSSNVNIQATYPSYHQGVEGLLGPELRVVTPPGAAGKTPEKR